MTRRVYCFLPPSSEPTLADFHGWTPSMQAVVETDFGDVHILPPEAIRAFADSRLAAEAAGATPDNELGERGTPDERWSPC